MLSNCVQYARSGPSTRVLRERRRSHCHPMNCVQHANPEFRTNGADGPRCADEGQNPRGKRASRTVTFCTEIKGTPSVHLQDALPDPAKRFRRRKRKLGGADPASYSFTRVAVKVSGWKSPTHLVKEISSPAILPL